MSAPFLRLADGLELPAAEALESVFVVVGKRGRGKSGFTRVLMEEFCRFDLPFIAFDPIGLFWGLRSSFNGEKAMYRVLVVGGAHADLPLVRTGGPALARAIIKLRIPHVVIDFSRESKSVYRQFIQEFADTIFRESADTEDARHIVIEEAPEVIPQRLRPDMARVFEAVERLSSRGRNRGLGNTLISPRMATLNKDVASSGDSFVCFGQTSPQDRKAIKEWVEAKAATDKLDEFMDGLAGLKRGEGWFWSPELFERFHKFKTATFKTFHPDRTHLRRHSLLDVEPVLADVSDIVAKVKPLLPAMAATVETTLRARVTELEERLAHGDRASSSSRTKTEIKTVKVPVLAKGDIRRLERAVARLTKLDDTKAITRLVTRLADAVVSLREVIDTVDQIRDRRAQAQQVVVTATDNIARVIREAASGRAAQPTAEAPRPSVPAGPVPAPIRTGHGVNLPEAARRVLTALAQFPAGATRRKAAILAGYAPSGSSMRGALALCRKNEYVVDLVGDVLRITPAGGVALGSWTPLPTGRALLDHWLGTLPEAAKVVLQVLAAKPEQPHLQADIETATSGRYQAGGSSMRGALARLRGLDLVVDESNGTRIAPELL